MNGFGKLRRFTDKRKIIVGFLSLPRRHLDRHPTVDQPSPRHLPLADQANDTSTPLTINCRTV
jgi:hypothetical protein